MGLCVTKTFVHNQENHKQSEEINYTVQKFVYKQYLRYEADI